VANKLLVIFYIYIYMNNKIQETESSNLSKFEMLPNDILGTVVQTGDDWKKEKLIELNKLKNRKKQRHVEAWEKKTNGTNQTPGFWTRVRAKTNIPYKTLDEFSNKRDNWDNMERDDKQYFLTKVEDDNRNQLLDEGYGSPFGHTSYERRLRFSNLNNSIYFFLQRKNPDHTEMRGSVDNLQLKNLNLQNHKRELRAEELDYTAEDKDIERKIKLIEEEISDIRGRPDGISSFLTNEEINTLGKSSTNMEYDFNNLQKFIGTRAEENHPVKERREQERATRRRRVLEEERENNINDTRGHEWSGSPYGTFTDKGGNTFWSLGRGGRKTRSKKKTRGKRKTRSKRKKMRRKSSGKMKTRRTRRRRKPHRGGVSDGYSKLRRQQREKKN